MDLLNYHNSNETTIHSCYRFESLFADCTSLAETPEILPAEKMSFACYEGMFSRCEKLTKAPSISATQLDDNCCQSMFEGCTSLTEAPDLPALYLANFYTANYCQITDMIDPVESGTFVKNAAATWPDIAVVKPGWTVVLATE